MLRTSKNFAHRLPARRFSAVIAGICSPPAWHSTVFEYCWPTCSDHRCGLYSVLSECLWAEDDVSGIPDSKRGTSPLSRPLLSDTRLTRLATWAGCTSPSEPLFDRKPTGERHNIAIAGAAPIHSMIWASAPRRHEQLDRVCHRAISRSFDRSQLRYIGARRPAC